MTLPPPEICRRILALHELLGFPEGKDEKRVEVFKLLEQHGLTWNSLPEFFAAMNVTTATPLPILGSKSWEKRWDLPVARRNGFVRQGWNCCASETH